MRAGRSGVFPGVSRAIGSHLLAYAFRHGAGCLKLREVAALERHVIDDASDNPSSRATWDPVNHHRFGLNGHIRSADLNRLCDVANRQICRKHRAVARVQSESLRSGPEPSHGHSNCVLTRRQSRQTKLPGCIGGRGARLRDGDFPHLDTGSRHDGPAGVGNRSHDLPQTIERPAIMFDIHSDAARF